MRVLEQRGSAPCVFEQSQRPKLVSDLDGKAYLEKALSSSTRKKLRQHRRRLSEKGALTSVIATEPPSGAPSARRIPGDGSRWLEGPQGHGAAEQPADAAFMRGAVGALAEHRSAAIHALYLDGKPVSMQIVVRAGAAAFTWKTAYDEQFQDISPGMLLLEDYTAAFLADKTIALRRLVLARRHRLHVGLERAADGRRPLDRCAARRLARIPRAQRLQGPIATLRATAKDAYLNWRKPRKK